MEEKHLWQDHLATCKGNTVYLKNVNFIFISGKKQNAYNNRIYKQNAINCILDERLFIILDLGQSSLYLKEISSRTFKKSK